MIYSSLKYLQTIKFDTLGREFLTIDNNGLGENDTPQLYSVRNTLDIAGNIIKVTDAKGREMTRHKYDMTGRLLKTYNIDSGTRIMLHDAADKPLRQADSRGHIIINTYDELQRPTETHLETSGGLSSVLIQKSEYGTIAQNLNGQVHIQKDQSGITTAEAYDFKGNPIQTKKQFTKDYQNYIDWSEATPNLLINSFSNSLIFDALNRPVKQTKPDDSIVLQGYNKAGLLETIQLDLSGQGTFDDYVTNINYNEKAQRTAIYYGNGTTTEYTYNTKNFRLTNLLTMRGSDKLQDISYIYDPEGNITEITDVAQSVIFFNNSMIEPKSTYEYDALYRLVKATGREHNSLANLSHNDFVNNIPLLEDGQNMRNYTQIFQYDEIGNLLQMKSNGVWTRDYKYNFAANNYLLDHDLNSTTDSYLYDTHGNMTKMPHLQELKWDYADNLKEVILDANGNTAYYVYDVNGNRVRKVVLKNNETIVENRFYVGDYESYRKTVNDVVETNRETLHITDDKQKVALIDSSLEGMQINVTIRYQYTNHLDSASLELDETGSIITYEEYHPFGTTSYRSGRSETEVSLKRYKYVHKELDNETGLYYYGMRYYAPWIARFISVDPLQFDYPQLTSYNYAGNKPVTYKDINGLQAEGDENRNSTPYHYRLNYYEGSVDVIEGLIKNPKNIKRERLKSIVDSTWVKRTRPKAGEDVRVECKECITDQGRGMYKKGMYKSITVGQNKFSKIIQDTIITYDTIPGKEKVPGKEGIIGGFSTKGQKPIFGCVSFWADKAETIPRPGHSVPLVRQLNKMIGLFNTIKGNIDEFGRMMENGDTNITSVDVYLPFKTGAVHDKLMQQLSIIFDVPFSITTDETIPESQYYFYVFYDIITKLADEPGTKEIPATEDKIIPDTTIVTKLVIFEPFEIIKERK